MAKAQLNSKKAVYLLLILSGSSTVKADILGDLGGLNNIMFGIAAGLAALVIVIQAIKWKTSESRIEREQAKKAIINVVLGLIIVLIAVSLVSVFYGTFAAVNPVTANCAGLDGWFATSFGPRCIGSQLCTDYVENAYRTYYPNAAGCSFTETQRNAGCKDPPQDCPAGQLCLNGACVSSQTTTSSTASTTSTTISLAGCNKCRDGTACWQPNAAKAECECIDNTNDGSYDQCALDDVGLCVKTCNDMGYLYGECFNDPTAPSVLCSWREDYVGDSLCPQAGGGTSHCCCGRQNANSTCDHCKDGTPCGQRDANGWECVCRQPPTWYYRVCWRINNCYTCSDGTECGKVNAAGKECKCDYPGGQVPEPGNTVTKSCDLVSTCDSCSDGTSCGQKNAADGLCDCTQLLPNNKYGDCTLRTVCDKCSDGTACGQTNAGGKYCSCDPYAGDGAILCSLYPTCNKCSDGTSCGQMNTQGNLCNCIKPFGGGKYWLCNMQPTCSTCGDGTACGQTSANTRKCECLNPAGAGKYTACISGCEKCSDGTLCGQTNSLGQPCKCSNKITPSSIYEVCKLDNAPIVPGKCQTYEDCYNQMGMCWICPEPGGNCKYASGEDPLCPDCHSFGEDYLCHGGYTHTYPYCCMRYYPTVDDFGGTKCWDGTAANACSSVYPGVRCVTETPSPGLVLELKPDPTCPGITCSETDGGRDPGVKGECTDVVRYYSRIFNDQPYKDHCSSGTTVAEAYCKNNACVSEDIACPAGSHCSDGHCV